MSRRSPSRCSCRTARPAGSASSSAPGPGCTPRSAPARPAPRRSATRIDMIRSGRADVVIAGGTEAAIIPLNIAGVRRHAGAVHPQRRAASAPPARSTRAGTASCSARARASWCWSRPSTRQRAAPGCYAVAAGVGYSADAHHIAQPDPEGTGIVLAPSSGRSPTPGVDPDQVVHVNAHATSTPAGDVVEGQAIAAALGAGGGRGGGVGHQVDDRAPARRRGRAGVGRHRSSRCGTRSPRPPSTWTTRRRRRRRHRHRAEGLTPHGSAPMAALNNSFGFGGHNVGLAFTAA